MKLLKNCQYLNSEGNFVRGDICIEGETISEVGSKIPHTENEAVDLNGLKIIPGLLDIHFHGALGYDVMEASAEELEEISGYLAKKGTTSYLATTITSTKEELTNALVNISKAASIRDNSTASIEGVHIEGPYISCLKKGCHNTDWMRVPSTEEFDNIKNILGGKLRIHMTVAPEIEGALNFIKYAVKVGATISIGHSNADSKTTVAALDSGAVIFTHLFNAMKGIDHREPGVAGAALNSDSYVELICDGVHVHPDIVNITLRLKGSDKIVLVTDAMKAAGLGDGVYEFGGFKVIVKDGIARKEDGTLASSTLTMFDAVKNIVRFTDVPLGQAVFMASKNPAKAIGIFNKVGSIDVGKRADLVVINDELEIIDVYCRGSRI